MTTTINMRHIKFITMVEVGGVPHDGTTEAHVEFVKGMQKELNEVTVLHPSFKEFALCIRDTLLDSELLDVSFSHAHLTAFQRMDITDLVIYVYPRDNAVHTIDISDKGKIKVIIDKDDLDTNKQYAVAVVDEIIKGVLS